MPKLMSKLHFHRNLPLFSAFRAEIYTEEGQGCPGIPQNVPVGLENVKLEVRRKDRRQKHHAAGMP